MLFLFFVVECVVVFVFVIIVVVSVVIVVSSLVEIGSVIAEIQDLSRKCSAWKDF